MSHDSKYLVSIIMPAYNAASSIAASIESVIAQSYDNWELIVVNDCSTDETPMIVSRFQTSCSRIRQLNLQINGGLPNARNEGCRVAKGDWIAFLDSDDIWHKDKLATQVRFHRDNPDIQISHTRFGVITNRPHSQSFVKIVTDPTKHKRGLLYPRVCYKNNIGILTVMVKKELLERVNHFDQSLWTMEDQDLWVRISALQTPFGFIDRRLAYYRISEGGISKNTPRYKRAYRHYIQKTLEAHKDLNENWMWRNYYRHFGTVYFKKKKFRLAQLYFWKSILLKPLDATSMSTVAYSALCLLGLVRFRLVRATSQPTQSNTRA